MLKLVVSFWADEILAHDGTQRKFWHFLEIYFEPVSSMSHKLNIGRLLDVVTLNYFESQLRFSLGPVCTNKNDRNVA